jgi:hypothetical protein
MPTVKRHHCFAFSLSVRAVQPTLKLNIFGVFRAREINGEATKSYAHSSRFEDRT